MWWDSLIIREDVKKSCERFDDEYHRFLQHARSSRSAARRGVIVVVEKTPTLYDFLSYLVKECSLSANVVNVDKSCFARKVIEDLGPEGIKAVIIESNMLADAANGDTLPGWIDKNFPKIPVWVVDFNGQTKTKVHCERVGVFVGATLPDVITELGFPPRCREMALQYTG